MVEAAGFAILCAGSIFSAGAVSRQSTVPVFRSRAIVSNFFPSYPVRKILLPQMQGEECPAGSAAFHKTFELELKCVGGSEPSPMPSPPGPRNCGQFAPGDAMVTRQIRRANERFI